MKKALLLSCLLMSLGQLQAQQATTHSMHFSQNGFVQNAGQFCDEHGRANNQVTFLYAKDDFHLALRPSGFSYELIQETPDVHNFPESGFSDPDDLQDWRDAQTMKESVCRVDITLKGANPHPVMVTDQNTGTLYNYYLGKLAVVNVPSFNRITYKNIYPGIDMVFEDHSENGGDPEYSFIVHPGGDVRQIQMKYSGAGNVSLEDQHTLSIAMPQGFIKETGLRGYWLEDGSASDVSFRLKNGMLSFNASVDKNKTLVIDPSIVWGSLFGGKASENWDTESEIALDGNNNVYLTGSTMSTKNIATTGAVMQTYAGNRDMLLAKFSLDGTHVLWATYFGGSEQDIAYGICCDSYNNVMITGFSKSPNVMTTPGVFQDTLLGISDAVIAKFSTTGQLIWSTLMGGSDDTNEAEHGRSMIRDSHDNIFICGYAVSSSNISTPGSYQVNARAAGEAFLVKFNKDGNKIWGTYFGGGGKDRAHTLCFDSFGHVYFAGTTKSKKFISVNGFQSVYGGSDDAYVAKFDTSGNFYWSTYYGGSKGDRGRGVRCDGAGYLYFTGWTNSVDANVISSSNGFQPSFGGIQDGFIVKFTPEGHRVWATYFGGNQTEIFYGMTIDPQANIYVCGSTASNTIATPDALQTIRGGGRDAMIAKFDSSGHRIWSTYLGGTGDDDSYDIERDGAGMIYLGVDSRGPLPTSQNAYQTTVRGQDDLGVFELNFNSLCTDNNEPNESFQSPHVIPDPITPSGVTINGAISTAIDEDWFSIHLDTLASVVITLTGLTKNYDLNVFNSSNVLIASSANAGTANEGITLNNDSGTFIIQIAHDTLNFDAYNCHTLHISIDTTMGNKVQLFETISSSANHRLKIYPNPSSGLMTAEFESSRESEMTITAFDAIGRIVFSRELRATEGVNTFSLNLSELNSGIYILEMKGSDVRNVIRFTIEK